MKNKSYNVLSVVDNGCSPNQVDLNDFGLVIYCINRS